MSGGSAFSGAAIVYDDAIDVRSPRDVQTDFAEALQFAEFIEAMRGLARYGGLTEGLDGEGETDRVDVTLFGFLKTPGHTMHVEKRDRSARVLQSREHDRSVSRWDHTLSVQPEGQGCRWTGGVVIDAARGAWATARFARHVHARRHRHRGALSISKAIRRP